MPNPDLAVVTGAFSYTGRYVTRRLLDQGVRVRTLTRSPDAEDPFGGQVEVAPLDFSDPDGLYHSMQGAGVFYNAYWVRYAHGRITIDLAVENTRMLFEAAKRAGVGRIVHFSVTNVSSGSALPYFRGKAPGGGHAGGPGNSLRHHQTNPGLRGRRPAAQQHGLGATALSRLPRLRERRLSGPARLRRRPCGPGGAGWFSERELRCRRCRAGHVLLRGPCFACWPRQWASEGGSYTRLRAWVSP